MNWFLFLLIVNLTTSRSLCEMCESCCLIYISINWLCNNAPSLADVAEIHDAGNKISALLDSSMEHVPIEPGGYYINISRVPNSGWHTSCERNCSYIECEVYTENLRLIIMARNKVNEFENIMLYSV